MGIIDISKESVPKAHQPCPRADQLPHFGFVISVVKETERPPFSACSFIHVIAWHRATASVAIHCEPTSNALSYRAKTSSRGSWRNIPHYTQNPLTYAVRPARRGRTQHLSPRESAPTRKP